MSIHLSRMPVLGRLFLLLVVCGVLGGAWSAILAPARPVLAAEEDTGKLRVYVGTYTGKSKGIYQTQLNLSTGELSAPALAVTTNNPSFLAIHPSQRFLYAVNESDGKVSAFAINSDTGALTLLNQQSSRGAAPAHLVVDRTGKNLLVANYSGGSVAVLPIGEDGRLATATGYIKHTGKSVDRSRQEAPHAHGIAMDVENQHAYVADLGLDKILIYDFNAAKGLLAPNVIPSADVPPGSGPRHFAFHPAGGFAYAINELKSTVTTFRHDPETGALDALQTLSTLPSDYKKSNSTAELVVHPSGKFLYGSNRGHNSIALFTIDEETGLLTAMGHTPTEGKTPRNFTVDPTGKYLLAANQESSSVVVFRIEAGTGQLAPTGIVVEVANPVCVVVLPAAAPPTAGE
jgi:6-phosphogluconolactonase